MKTKNLQSIIKSIDSLESLQWEQIEPYKKLLYVYYKNMYCCEPIFMVTFLTNAICAGYIVPENDFMEYVYEELNISFIDAEDEGSDAFSEVETILYNSRFLKDLIS